MSPPPRKRRNLSSTRSRLRDSNGLLLAYYGDDFTGSTDVMEALASAGLHTVLFVSPPGRAQLAKFPGLRAFGIAGSSRTMSPPLMERELRPAFKALQSSGAPLVHYKVCSTFDSSPVTGSIGRAIEIGRRVFGNRPTPLVVGAPVLGRYVVFGNLFARSGLDSEPSRLDRHPTMSRHPVTPMDEADLRLLLAKQTKLPVELVDTLKLEAGGPCSEYSIHDEPAPIVLFDTLLDSQLGMIGREIERLAGGKQLFVAGSSGVEYALVRHWQQGIDAWARGTQRTGLRNTPASPAVPGSGPARSGLAASPQIIVVSGSCSPVTERQMDRALKAGFVEIPLHAKHLARESGRDVGRGFVVRQAQHALADGRSVVLHTSRGPNDPRVIRRGRKKGLAARLGEGLGLILDDLLKTTGIRRAVVCGGDTSTHVGRVLGIEALEYLAPMAPGSPLCRVHAPGRAADAREIVFKGGQVGRDDFFLDVLKGGPS